MTEACQYLHYALSRLPRLNRVDDPLQLPKNGIYVVFQNGEKGHGRERIVRVGINRAQNDDLPGRLRQHLKPNKDKSIFRKHVGRCLIAKRNEIHLLELWEKHLSSFSLNEREVVRPPLQEVEEEVTRYMVKSFSFAVLSFDRKTDRHTNEKHLLSTICACRDCGPFETWLGNFHPERKVRDSGLYNVQNLKDKVLSLDEARRLVEAGLSA